MRKVTETQVNNYLNDVQKTVGNTTVSVNEDTTAMMYHGNIIALKDRKSGAIQITNCGWETNTTKERLNGLIQAVKGHEQKIYQRNFNWYLDIDGVKTEFPYAQYVTL